MTATITGIERKGNRISFIVVLGDADGGLIEMPFGDFQQMVKKSNQMYHDISDFNGKKCRVNLHADNRLIRVTGL